MLNRFARMGNENQLVRNEHDVPFGCAQSEIESCRSRKVKID